MISVSLAAGYATRLYPLTENFPKPLLPVGGVPILERLLADADNIPEISRHVVVSNHRFIDHFAKWRDAAPLRKPVDLLDDGSVSNDTRLGAVRDVFFAIERLALDDDLLVLAGDNCLDFSLKAFTDYFLQKRASCVMRYFEPDENVLRRCGVLVPDADGRVVSMTEKPAVPPSHWAVPPFYIYARADVPCVRQGIIDGCGTDAPGSFIAYLCARRPVYAMEMPGRRYDVGTLAGYEAIRDSGRWPNR